MLVVKGRNSLLRHVRTWIADVRAIVHYSMLTAQSIIVGQHTVIYKQKIFDENFFLSIQVKFDLGLLPKALIL